VATYSVKRLLSSSKLQLLQVVKKLAAGGTSLYWIGAFSPGIESFDALQLVASAPSSLLHARPSLATELSVAGRSRILALNIPSVDGRIFGTSTTLAGSIYRPQLA